MRRSLLIILLLTLAVAGCGNDNPAGPSAGGGGTTTLPNGSMSATVDGAAWNATAITVNYIPPAASFDGVLTILGTNAALRTVMLTVAPTGAGTYNFGPRLLTNMVLSENSAQGWNAGPEFPGSTGTITFTTQTSNRAVGSFSFTAVAAPSSGATGTRTVTNGVFNVTF